MLSFRVAWVTPRVCLPPALPLDSLAAQSIHAYQLSCLLRVGTGCCLPLRKQAKMFCQWRGIVGWPPWLQAGPQGGSQWAHSLLLLERVLECWLSAAGPLQLCKHGGKLQRKSLAAKGPS